MPGARVPALSFIFSVIKELCLGWLQAGLVMALGSEAGCHSQAGLHERP